MIATACGYRWPEIDEMTLIQFRELAAYWRQYPPAHLLLAALFGPKREKKSDLTDLFAHFERPP